MKLIAEFCQNHNGDMEILKDMVWQASEAGATHGKIQTIFADDLSYREEFEDGVTDEDGTVAIIKRPYKLEYERLKGLELEYVQHIEFIDECKKAGITPMTTAFNITSLNSLKEMGWDTIKVASYDCASLPLIDALSDNFDELIISTGATFDSEIETTAKLLNDKSTCFSFLHCVTIYPTPLSEIHLNRMKYLRKFTKSVGLSEHTRVSDSGVKACLAAIYMGADIVERHFTILNETETRDGPVSIKPEHVKEIMSFSRLSDDDRKLYLSENVPEFSSMMGDETRELSHAELLNRAYYRGRFSNKINGKQIFNWQNEVREYYGKG